jgi:hypothetical protein
MTQYNFRYRTKWPSKLFVSSFNRKIYIKYTVATTGTTDATTTIIIIITTTTTTRSTDTTKIHISIYLWLI